MMEGKTRLKCRTMTLKEIACGLLLCTMRIAVTPAATTLRIEGGEGENDPSAPSAHGSRLRMSLRCVTCQRPAVRMSRGAPRTSWALMEGKGTSKGTTTAVGRPTSEAKHGNKASRTYP